MKTKKSYFTAVVSFLMVLATGMFISSAAYAQTNKISDEKLVALKQKALTKGYRVISKEQAAVSKLTPDPKRVVVEVVQMNCIKAPCPQVYNIVSAGV